MEIKKSIYRQKLERRNKRIIGNWNELRNKEKEASDRACLLAIANYEGLTETTVRKILQDNNLYKIKEK